MPFMKRMRAAVIACALAAACGNDPTEPSEPLPPLPGFDGRTQFVDTLEYGGYEWVSRVHLPRGYEHSDEARLPLFLALHGSGEDAEQHQAFIGLDQLADANGFVAVYPDWMRSRKITSADVQRDSPGFIRFLARNLSERYAIDPDRTVATGFSAGGMLAGRLACEADAVVSGIAPVGATLPADAAAACAANTVRPLPVLYSLGENDNSVPPEGRADLLSLSESADVWRRIGRCAENPDVRYDPADPGASPRIETTEYTGCAAGSVRTDLLSGVGHRWLRASQNANGIDVTEIVVAFLLSHMP